MKKLYLLAGFILLIAVLAGCKSASKLYQKGNYDEAVEVAVKKLQKKPDDEDLRSLILSAYKYAVNDHENRIHNLSENANELKWEWIYNEYADLQRLYDAIYRAPEIFELVHPFDFSSYLNTYAEKAGTMHFDRGMQWMNNHDKQSYKNAYHEFQAALRFKNGDITIQNMLNEAYEGALTRVLIMPVNEYGFRYSSFDYTTRNFDNDIASSLQNYSGNEFVRFFSSLNQAGNFQPDEIVELRYSKLDIGRIHEDYNSRGVSKEIVVKETVYRPDSIVKQYATVKARITTTKRSMYSEGILEVNIRNSYGNFIWNDFITGSHNWCSEFTTYTGDERALSDEDKRIINNSKRENVPDDYEITRCIRQNIYNDFLARIRNHYSGY